MFRYFLKNIKVFVITLMILLIILPLRFSCFIQGTDSGYCTNETLDYEFRIGTDGQMPFCGKYIEYPACLPVQNTQIERWAVHSVDYKDRWVEQMAREHNRFRRDLEIPAIEGDGMGEDEYGDTIEIVQRFFKNPDCKHAFYRLFCFINFPRCDMERQLSLPTCKSACENYFIACNFPEDLWRCGKSKWYNGNSAEKSSDFDTDGNDIYLRDYFPGNPFRKNKFKADGETQRPICTPAITGQANTIYRHQMMTFIHGIIIIFLYSIYISLMK